MNHVFERSKDWYHECSSHTCVLGKADGQRRLLDFLLEQIFLVQKEYDRRIGKPLVVADGVEQLHAFHHAILQRVQRDAFMQRSNLIHLTTVKVSFINPTKLH